MLANILIGNGIACGVLSLGALIFYCNCDKYYNHQERQATIALWITTISMFVSINFIAIGVSLK